MSITTACAALGEGDEDEDDEEGDGSSLPLLYKIFMQATLTTPYYL